MNVGIVGNAPLAAVAARRLMIAHRVHVFGDSWNDELIGEGAVSVPSLALLARGCDVIVIAETSTADVRARLFAADGLCEGLSAGKLVIDQTLGDPDEARAIAAEVEKLGASWVDAPLHCERLADLTDAAAILCGGSAAAVEAARPVLEALCPKVVLCGDAGSGRAAALVVTAVAVCNRLVTYECAAMGFRNGLAVGDMATVLNRCSGANSGTVRVLPALDVGGRTADVDLASVVARLNDASRLAMRVGAPMQIANLARSLLQAELNALGPSAQLDDTFRIFKAAAGHGSATA